MCAEVALRQPPVRFAGQRRAVGDEVGDRSRRLAGQELDGRRVGEVVRLGDRVGGVLLPGVFRIHDAQRGVDAARCEHAVRVVGAPLADAQHLVSRLCELDRGTQTRRAGPDDEHARGAPPFVGGGSSHDAQLATSSRFIGS